MDLEMWQACSHAVYPEASWTHSTLRPLPNRRAGFSPISRAGHQNQRAAPMKNASFTPAELNDGFVVAIMLEAKEGEADAVAAIAQKLIPPSMAEPGVKVFIPYRSPTNPSLFFIYELYVEEAAWGEHEKTAHFKEAIKELLPRLVRRERVPFIPFLTV
jgi:quinol monooxygenase YgiN